MEEDQVPIMGADVNDAIEHHIVEQEQPGHAWQPGAGIGADGLPHRLARLVSSDPPPFKKIKSIPWAITGIAASGVMIMLVFILPIVCNKPPGPGPSPSPGPHGMPSFVDNGSKDWLCTLEPLSLMLYTHVAHWVVHLMVDQALKSKHKTSRIKGYSSFYLETKNTRRTPFYLVSVGNALLLVTITALHDYCDPDYCEDKFTRVDYLRGLITLECLIIISLWTYYCITVKKFNKTQPVPDCMNKGMLAEMMVSTMEDGADVGSTHEITNSGHLRPLEPPSNDQILERQAEVIRYLQEHNEKQSLKILQLNRRVREVTAAAARNA